MFRIQASGRGIEFRYCCDPGISQYVVADDKRLRQILINLLSNAIKYTKQGYASLEGMGGWLGVFAPSKTPKDIIDKIAGAMGQALKSDDLKAAMAELGYEATGTPTDKFAVIVKQDTERWGAVIKSVGGITID